MDSTYDSLASTWRVEPRETALSFTLAPDTIKQIPIIFEIHAREARRPDTLASSLEIVVPRVALLRNAADSALNEAILQSVLAFYWCCGDTLRSGPYPRLDSVMGEFPRLWKDFDGFFSDDYWSEVLFNELGILSLEFSSYVYAGGAHGSGNTRFASFDVTTGKQLSLEDIPKPGYGKELGYSAGSPNCLDSDEEYPCTAQGVVEHGFAFTREGLMFHKDIAGYEEDLVFPYGDLAQFARKDSPLDLVCKSKSNTGNRGNDVFRCPM